MGLRIWVDDLACRGEKAAGRNKNLVMLSRRTRLLVNRVRPGISRAYCVVVTGCVTALSAMAAHADPAIEMNWSRP